MTAAATLASFTFTAALLTITPGLDTALVIRTAVAEGQCEAMAAALGIALDCLGWGLLVGLGLGALIATSRLAYDELSWGGALYLLYLGIKLIRRPRRDFDLPAKYQDPLGRQPNWLLRGFLTNLLNPKVGVIYVSFLPQFVQAGADVPGWSVMLAGVHNMLGLLWFAMLVRAARPLTAALQKPGVLAWFDRLTGTLFITFGL